MQQALTPLSSINNPIASEIWEEKENVPPSNDAPACLISPWFLSLQN